LQIHNVSEEEKSKGEDVVSFDDVMDAADRAADALKVSGINRVSDRNARRRRQRHARLMEVSRCKMRTMFSESSSATEYSSDSQVFVTIDGPMWEASSKCNTTMIQGRQEVVIVHLCSGLEEDIDID